MSKKYGLVHSPTRLATLALKPSSISSQTPSSCNLLAHAFSLSADSAALHIVFETCCCGSLSHCSCFMCVWVVISTSLRMLDIPAMNEVAVEDLEDGEAEGLDDETRVRIFADIGGGGGGAAGEPRDD